MVNESVQSHSGVVSGVSDGLEVKSSAFSIPEEEPFLKPEIPMILKTPSFNFKVDGDLTDSHPKEKKFIKIESTLVKSGIH